MAVSAASSSNRRAVGYRFCRVVASSGNNSDRSGIDVEQVRRSTVPVSAHGLKVYSRVALQQSATACLGYDYPVFPECVALMRYQGLTCSVAKRFSWLYRKGLVAAMVLTAGFCCVIQVAEYFSVRLTNAPLSGQPARSIPKPEPLALADAESELGVMTRLATYLIANAASSSAISQERNARLLDRAQTISEKLMARESDPGRERPRSTSMDNSSSTWKAGSPIGSAEQPNFDRTITPPATAMIHQNATGEPDYWLVPSSKQAGGLDRVIPFAQTGTGTAVYNIDDGCDYIITPSGRWGKFGLY